MKRTSLLLNNHIRLPLLLFVMGGAMHGCGVVGPPLPPEDIGIEAKVRSQKQAKENVDQTGEQVVPLGEEDVSLPALKPLGAQ